MQHFCNIGQALAWRLNHLLQKSVILQHPLCLSIGHTAYKFINLLNADRAEH